MFLLKFNLVSISNEVWLVLVMVERNGKLECGTKKVNRKQKAKLHE